MSEKIDRHWNLRNQLYNLLHSWPWITGAIIIGAILGWAFSYLWPAHYRASSQIYIALNPYRRYSDTIFEALANPKYSNLDNYQYWQMSQLESAVYLDRFLLPTLEKLRQEDPYWENITPEELRSMLDSEWRTTGTWSLIANHPKPDRARQAARAWSATVLDQISLAVDASRRAIMIDQELRAGEEKLLQDRLRLEELSLTTRALDNWLKAIEQSDTDSQLDPDARWRLFALISYPADFSPTWLAVLENQPPDGAPIREYTSWIEQARVIIQGEVQALEQRIRTIDNQLTEKAGQFALESKASLSFSPNIEVERKEDQDVRMVRPKATFILIGGIVGLLAFLLYQLIMISLSRRNL